MEKHISTFIREGERVDDLQTGGLKIIQNPSWFCFGIDAVLLSNFADIRKHDRVVEFGTGTGVIPILMAGRTENTHITAFEIQEAVADMASRSVSLNGLESRIRIINDDLNHVTNHIDKATVDAVVTNPPYMSGGCGIINPEDQKAISRHEIHCTLEEVISRAADVLKPGGAFYMIHRPHRLVDIVWHMRQRGIEPKLLRFVQPKANQKPNILLIKGVRGGRPELKYMDPLVVYEPDGSYTEEIFRIYGQERIDVFEKRTD